MTLKQRLVLEDSNPNDIYYFYNIRIRKIRSFYIEKWFYERKKILLYLVAMELKSY
jgi:hypothetical protein